MNKLSGILLIDDDNIVNFITQDILEKLGLTDQLFVVNNGLEGINFLKAVGENQSFPELIFLDLNMPIMDGFDFLKALEEMDFPGKARIKIVVLTTSSISRDVEKAIKMGCHDFVTKPLTEGKVLELLDKHFGQEIQSEISF